ncbi:MAG TPA: MBOAT family O-acyltransferase [Pirellulales bacterium]|nr:MBOAT family O-acyltransferase [Pirellulales bacterium]
MLFCSEQFLIFFTIVFVAYWAMPWRQARVYLLLAASFYFYASWNQWLALIIGVSTTIDYFVARGIDASDDPRRRKLLMSVTIVANLGLLCYFKYANFFLQSLETAMRAAGSTTSLPLLKVMLPIGISFYTFEAINYAVDVYRRHTRAERNLAHFMLFITFFPHLVAGPIVRARDFLPQIRRVKHWDWARMQLGAQLFLMGLFKKLAIADRMAMFADPVFANPEQYRTSAAWLAVLAYALQIYCDFSGYTDMALGSAHLLGYKLARNFDMPYASANIAEFWRRWHISLSTWLRDYLFIPLGGSRGASWQTNRNLMITMTLGGLWHGASWTFVVWGIVHGALLIAHRSFRQWCASRPGFAAVLTTHAGTAARIALTFTTVSLAWVFFRATTFTAAAAMFQRLFTAQTGMAPPLAKVSLIVLSLVVLAAHALALSGAWRKLAPRLPAPVLGVSYATVLTLALLLAPDSGKAFIYFQF